MLDAAGSISVFEVASRFARNTPAVRVLAVDAGDVRSSSSVEMVARDFRSAGAIETLIVAGGDSAVTASRCKATRAFVQRLASRGVRIASVCSGAYILA